MLCLSNTDRLLKFLKILLFSQTIFDFFGKMSNILAESYMQMADDTKFIRLTTLTSFIHSLVFTFFVIFNIYRLIDKIQPDLVSGVNIAYILQNLSTIVPPAYYILIGLILVI